MQMGKARRGWQSLPSTWLYNVAVYLETQSRFLTSHVRARSRPWMKEGHKNLPTRTSTSHPITGSCMQRAHAL